MGLWNELWDCWIMRLWNCGIAESRDSKEMHHLGECTGRSRMLQLLGFRWRRFRPRGMSSLWEGAAGLSIVWFLRAKRAGVVFRRTFQKLKRSGESGRNCAIISEKRLFCGLDYEGRYRTIEKNYTRKDVPKWQEIRKRAIFDAWWRQCRARFVSR